MSYRITKNGDFDRRYKGGDLDNFLWNMFICGAVVITGLVFLSSSPSETSNTKVTHSQPVTSIQPQPKVAPVIIEQLQPVIVTEEVKSDPIVLTEDETVSDEESLESDDSIATVHDRKFKPWD